MEEKITEAFALDLLIKMSAKEIKATGGDEHRRSAALNALRRFALCFFPEEECSVKQCGDGCELSAYEMAYNVIKSTSSPELKALWFIFYPYLVAASPHIDDALYELTAKELSKEEVLKAVLESRYRLLVEDCGEDLEAAGLAGMYLSWYEPYAAYKSELTENGDTREIALYKKLLASGEFSAVAEATNKMLDRNPFDPKTALLNISARVSILGATPAERADELKDVVSLIDEFLARDLTTSDMTFFHYYRGLCLLGLTASGEIALDDVKNEFMTCLELTPSFELATFMLKAIDSKLDNLN